MTTGNGCPLLVVVVAFGPLCVHALIHRKHLPTIPAAVRSRHVDRRPFLHCYYDYPRASILLPKTKASAATEDCIREVLQQSPPFLTVVIPAYNEQDRIGTTLRTYQNYLKEHEQWQFGRLCSILVVDDGSTDQTVAVVQKIASATIQTDDGSSELCTIQCLSLSENRGKGGAIAAGIAKVIRDSRRAGIAAGHPKLDPSGLLLTADADGSADPSCAVVLYEELVDQLSHDVASNLKHQPWRTPALVCGYRVYDVHDKQDGETETRKRASPSSSPIRQFFHWGFRSTVRALFWGTRLNEIRDTQCGCKLLTLEAARRLYTDLHLQRWSHDVEVLWRAVYGGIPIIGQAPVLWRDCAGSRLSAEGVLRVAWTMLLEILFCRVAYAIGWWRVEPGKEKTD